MCAHLVVRISLRLAGGLTQPFDDLSVYLVRAVKLEVMHPATGRRLHDLLEPRRGIMSIERDGEHNVCVRATEVLAGQP